jgi:hypothetical protein
MTFNPWIFTGLLDGEGSFLISIVKNDKSKTGWVIKLRAQISLHRKDKAVLELLKAYFNAGNIYKLNEEAFQFQIESFKDLQLVIDHYNKYPLRTKKWEDFMLFKEAYNIVKDKNHLTKEGLMKIVSLKASLNNGLSNTLKNAFPDVIPAIKPVNLNQVPLDPNWIVGFTSAEGCFFVNTYKTKTKVGIGVQLAFSITQHTRDEVLMNSLVSNLGCGRIKTNIHSQFTWVDYIVTKFSDIDEKIIPFFRQNKVLGVKLQDFEDWCKVAELIKNKAHLTPSGLEEIQKIKAGMNRGRIL